MAPCTNMAEICITENLFFSATGVLKQTRSINFFSCYFLLVKALCWLK